MDSEKWISSLATAKRFYAAQLSQLNNISGMELELEEDDGEGDMELELEMQQEEATWPDVACPYCYEDHDVASLCAHLEEDHPYEPHPAPCPICFEKITRDMLNHITVQHGYLFKSGRRLHRFIIPDSNALSLMSGDLREAQLQALLAGGRSHRTSNTTTTNISDDPLLSSFGMDFATSDLEEPSKAPVLIPDDTSMLKGTPAQPREASIDLSLTSEEREQKRKQAVNRATFVQDLVRSTIFGD